MSPAEIAEALERYECPCGPYPLLTQAAALIRSQGAEVGRLQIKLRVDMDHMRYAAEREAKLRAVADAARALTSWDWTRLLVDHPDADDVRADVTRVDAALAALTKDDR